jgi:protein-S-isoprenylcysteine O-methyltransferase Ste14
MSDQGSNAHLIKDRHGEHPYGDAGQVALLGVFLVVWVTDSFFLHESTFLSTYVPAYIGRSILVLAVGSALLLFVSSRVVLLGTGLVLQWPTAVVTTGAFRYVRHPMYLAAILGYLGSAISTFSLASLGLVLGIFIFYDYIAGYEEKLLEVKFGEKYKMYEQRTGKWLPRIR